MLGDADLTLMRNFATDPDLQGLERIWCEVRDVPPIPYPPTDKVYGLVHVPTQTTMGYLYFSMAAEFLKRGPSDMRRLLAEVERLRAAIANHKRRVVIDPQPWDRDLWAVLDA